MTDPTDPAPEGARSALVDQRAPTERFLEDVITGLGAAAPSLPCKYLYDAQGSALFEAICEQPEYYLTRTELAILRDHVAAMAAALGPRCLVVEPGTGEGLKTRLLLESLEAPAGYAPVEISLDALEQAAARLRAAFPDIEILPVCADFTDEVALPEPTTAAARRVVYFPGSTIGNFGPAERVALLARFARLAGPGGALLLGADLKKDPAVLEAAYDDAAGVTAAFTRNILAHVARALDAEVDPEGFAHRARWDAAEGCIDIRLESLRDQTLRVGDRTFRFARGAEIRVERSYKFELDALRAELARAGWAWGRAWTDPDGRFAVILAEVAPPTAP